MEIITQLLTSAIKAQASSWLNQTGWLIKWFGDNFLSPFLVYFLIYQSISKSFSLFFLCPHVINKKTTSRGKEHGHSPVSDQAASTFLRPYPSQNNLAPPIDMCWYAGIGKARTNNGKNHLLLVIWTTITTLQREGELLDHGGQLFWALSLQLGAQKLQEHVPQQRAVYLKAKNAAILDHRQDPQSGSTFGSGSFS